MRILLLTIVLSSTTLSFQRAAIAGTYQKVARKKKAAKPTPTGGSRYKQVSRARVSNLTLLQVRGTLSRLHPHLRTNLHAGTLTLAAAINRNPWRRKSVSQYDVLRGIETVLREFVGQKVITIEASQVRNRGTESAAATLKQKGERWGIEVNVLIGGKHKNTSETRFLPLGYGLLD